TGASVLRTITTRRPFGSVARRTPAGSDGGWGVGPAAPTTPNSARVARARATLLRRTIFPGMSIPWTVLLLAKTSTNLNALAQMSFGLWRHKLSSWPAPGLDPGVASPLTT